MSCTILIVDDSPILRAAIRKVARLAGVEDDCLFEAGNGQEALDFLADTSVDLILLDINMPVMDGEQFVAAARAKPELADQAIVIVSTEQNRERLGRLADMGVHEVLNKPFEPEELCAIIAEKLGVEL